MQQTDGAAARRGERAGPRTFQPRRASSASRRAASFLYSAKMSTRLARLPWYLCSSASSRLSRAAGSMTSTTCAPRPRARQDGSPTLSCLP